MMNFIVFKQVHVLKVSPPNTSRQSNILRLQGDTLGMDSTQHSIFEQAYKVGFRCSLKGKQRLHIIPKGFIMLPINRCDLSYHPGEGESRYQEVGGVLVLANLSEGFSAWSVPSFFRRRTLLRRSSTS